MIRESASSIGLRVLVEATASPSHVGHPMMVGTSRALGAQASLHGLPCVDRGVGSATHSPSSGAALARLPSGHRTLKRTTRRGCPPASSGFVLTCSSRQSVVPVEPHPHTGAGMVFYLPMVAASAATPSPWPGGVVFGPLLQCLAPHLRGFFYSRH